MQPNVVHAAVAGKGCLGIDVAALRTGKTKMSTKLEPIPDFANEDEERQFWQTHDSTDYVDWSKAERVRLPKLKASTAARAGSADKRIIPTR